MPEVQESVLGSAQEVWKVIPEFPKYAVSDHGRVKRVAPWICGRTHQSTRHSGVLKPRLHKGGYLYVDPHKNNRPHNRQIHRLVLTTFHRPPRDNEECNHINGIKTDNRLENLEWVTPAYNSQHAIRTGLKIILRGEQHGMCKLTEEQVRFIRSAPAVPYHGYRQQLAKQFHISGTQISGIRSRTSWRHLP